MTILVDGGDGDDDDDSVNVNADARSMPSSNVNPTPVPLERTNLTQRMQSSFQVSSGVAIARPQPSEPFASCPAMLRRSCGSSCASIPTAIPCADDSQPSAVCRWCFAAVSTCMAM